MFGIRTAPVVCGPGFVSIDHMWFWQPATSDAGHTGDLNTGYMLSCPDVPQYFRIRSLPGGRQMVSTGGHGGRSCSEGSREGMDFGRCTDAYHWDLDTDDREYCTDVPAKELCTGIHLVL